jgi:hypothetical protein
VATPLFDSHLNVSGNTASLLFSIYDVTTDGKRFVIVEPVGSKSLPTLTAIVNWSAELKK